jgi:hypothetical protein
MLMKMCEKKKKKRWKRKKEEKEVDIMKESSKENTMWVWMKKMMVRICEIRICEVMIEVQI